MTKTIPQLTEDTNPASTAYIEISTSGVSRKSLVSNIHKNMTQGTATQAGTLELATDAEALTGTDTARAITPANLRAVLASAPDGTMYNLEINVTVSSSDLIVALKTHAGTDPSATDPGYVKINGTVRSVTATTSMTLADATNWFASGSTELATKELDYFAYAVWDSNSSIVAVSAARRPDGRLVSDFSATTTNQSYLGNYANFTSTDDVTVIARFAATLSAAAGHVWTVPTFTNLNLIQHPIYYTRVITTTCTVTAQTGTPTTTTVNGATMQVIGKRVVLMVDVSVVAKGTASNSIIMTTGWTGSGIGYGSETAATGYVLSCAYGVLASNAISMRKYDATTVWVDGYRCVGVVNVPL